MSLSGLGAITVLSLQSHELVKGLRRHAPAAEESAWRTRLTIVHQAYCPSDWPSSLCSLSATCCCFVKLKSLTGHTDFPQLNVQFRPQHAVRQGPPMPVKHPHLAYAANKALSRFMSFG